MRKDLLARNQGNITNQYLTQNEGQAYKQALQNYQLPYQTIAGLQQTANPGAFGNTPNAQIQPANYQGAVEQNYQQQSQNYNSFWSGLGSLAGSVGSVAAKAYLGK